MTPAMREALEALCRRFDQMGSTAKILACDTDNSANMSDALLGLGETLVDLCGKMDAIINPLLAPSEDAS
ncbi:hypothetical protein ABIC16_000268 [Sphingomonas sp. PvP055]|uniref:hypothetical protein n=1 Tax=Sphingomonas sp. PvP055 TaxID=3156391 RepID=UPI003397523F